jgi:hypothetical protein
LKELGYSRILRGNNPGTWGPNTNNLISYLLSLKCTEKEQTLKLPRLTPSVQNKTVKKVKGCIVVKEDNWWLDYA